MSAKSRGEAMPLVTETLRATPVFSAFADADLEAVGRFSHIVSLAPDEVLYREGEPCGAMYCVISGLIKLYVLGPDLHEKSILFVEPGRTFGEPAVFSGQGYSLNAMAVDVSRVIAVDAYSLMRYLRQKPELSWQMLAVMSRLMHQLIGQVRSAALQRAEQRLAAYLLDNYDPGEPEQPVVRNPMRRSELASLLGLTTETVCRVVASFRRSGWIRTAANEILIDEPDALRHVVERPPR